jgi:hypothetical protein
MLASFPRGRYLRKLPNAKRCDRSSRLRIGSGLAVAGIGAGLLIASRCRNCSMRFRRKSEIRRSREAVAGVSIRSQVLCVFGGCTFASDVL